VQPGSTAHCLHLGPCQPKRHLKKKELVLVFSSPALKTRASSSKRSRIEGEQTRVRDTRSRYILPAFAGFFAIALTGQTVRCADRFRTKHTLPAGIARAFEAHVTSESENHCHAKCLLDPLNGIDKRSRRIIPVSRYAEIVGSFAKASIRKPLLFDS